ncbi:RHS repeat domain-containing protein [Microlunatus ginsengisoli]|uniref:RHS repeat-associated core domain-containing protein n=1 Tax=Microlunatus ginsengisoli TaxID=363863 RepID=A0ABP6ZIY3_9ACTN
MSSPQPARTHRRTLAGVVAAVALALLAVYLVTPPPRASAATTAPVGSLSLGTGLSGRVDPRTGEFSVSVPVADIRGIGDAGIAFSLSWQQARATASIDRSGWGAGWSLSTSFVNTNGQKRVYPASGGSYLLDPTTPSGLADYKLADLVFTQLQTAQTLRARAGAPAVAYWYTLAYDDGRTDYFDVNGNLVARADRFGNRTDIAWQSPVSGQWRPLSIVDSYGLSTTFRYPTQSQIQVISPERSDGVTSVTTIDRSSANGVQTLKVTDPVGNVTTFDATAVKDAPKPLLTTVTAATGAKTRIGYQEPAYEKGLIAVDTVMVTDGANNQLSPTQRFDLDPALPATNDHGLPSANNRHNYTGYPNHLPANGKDTLFSSGDASYYYSAGLTTGATTTVSTYDALHRLVQRTVGVAPPGSQQPILAQTQTMTYPVAVTFPNQLPANWARTKTASLTSSAATSSKGLTPSPAPRTTTVATQYDDHGRVTSATDETGAVTVTGYGPYGLIQKQTTTGADGSVAQTDNTFTGSGTALSIGTTTTSVGQPGHPPTARQTVSYTYDGTGQVASRTLAWAPGAGPDPGDGRGGGPDSMVTTFSRTLSSDAKTVTLTTTTGAGTGDAQHNTAVIDTVSGKPVGHFDAADRKTSFGYDAIGRQVSTTTPGGLTTTTAYTPTQTTVSGPDGRITRSTVDLLGRTVSVTDNVRNRAFTTDPGARTLSSTSYSADGSTATATDQAGRTTTTTVDAFGRVVSKVGAGGVTQLSSYDDGAAHTSTSAVVPDGAGAATSSMVTSYDDRGRAIGTDTSFAAGSAVAKTLALPADQNAATAYNGIGQPTTTTGGDLELTTDHSGPGGLAVSSTATPQATGDFPGAAITASTVRSLSGDAISRTLHQGSDVSTAVAVSYDATGEVVAATDPAGRVTHYTYTADGQPATKTSPSGAVTTRTYDPVSGLLAKIVVTAPGKATRTISYTRVPAGQPGAGQVKTVTDGTATISYGYDVDGHRTSVGYPDGTATSAAYNDKGQLVSSTDITGAVTSYVYNPGDGTMASATQKRGSALLASVSYGYDAMDRVQTVKRGNGVVTTNTYTADNRLAVQSTTDSANKVLESHAYSYDDHGNVDTRVDTIAPGGGNAVPGGPLTWTTRYSYDAYNRLTGSAVYPGSFGSDGSPTAPAATQTAYTLDVAGDVTATKTTTRTAGIRPIISTSTTSNTIDASGRLTGQRTGSQTAGQTFDDDGHVLTSLTGLTTSYTADGTPATLSRPDGTTIGYTRWPDGTLRSATTKAPDGSTSTVSYHYGVDGALLNDSTSDTGTAAGTSTTASYLISTGREARTLVAGAAASGGVSGAAAAPTTTGPGAGYYLRDRHNSVTAVVDSTGAITAGYGYTDYGAPARADGRRISVGVLDGGRTNPFGYAGAAVQGPITDVALNLIRYADRSYNPVTGRFTGPDPVDAHNLYQGFRTNPIVYSDLSGHDPIIDAVMDGLFAVIFVATAILTIVTGLAPVLGAIAAAGYGAIAEVTGAVVANAVVSTLAVAANLTGAATSAALAIDDDRILATGKGYFDTDQRSMVSLVNTAASVLAGGAGAVQGATASSVAALEDATAAAKQAQAARASTTVNDLAIDATNNTQVVPDEANRASVHGDDPVDPPGANQGDGGGQIVPRTEQNQADPLRQPDNANQQRQDPDLLVPAQLPPLPELPAAPPPDYFEHIYPEVTLELPADRPLLRQTAVNGANEAQEQVRTNTTRTEVNDPPGVPADLILTGDAVPATLTNEPGIGTGLVNMTNDNVLVTRTDN